MGGRGDIYLNLNTFKVKLEAINNLKNIEKTYERHQ